MTPNLRSFIGLAQKISFEVSKCVHSVTISTPDPVSFTHPKFSEKSSRKFFNDHMRKYFKNLLKWDEYSSDTADKGYTVSIQPKKDPKFLLYKIRRINLEQKEALSLLAKKCGVKTKDLSYAGTKDSRAEIIQHFSIKNCKNELEIGMEIGTKLKILEITPIPRHIQLGEIKKNIFEINVETEKTDGLPDSDPPEEFYNYFGLQRFGVKHESVKNLENTDEFKSYFFTSTPLIGILLLCGQFEKAALNALAPSCDRQDAENETCREIVEGQGII